MSDNIPSTASAVQISSYTNSPTGANTSIPLDSVISVVPVPVPKPGPGEALVRLTLRPVNPSDVFTVNGVYPGFQPTSMPATPGLEGMGVVATLGPATASCGLTVGQRVTCTSWGAKTGKGTWQQYSVVDADTLVAVPDEVTDEFAASAVVNPITILGLLDTEPIPEGEHLLINSSGSALNRMLLQLARKRGIKVIGVIRRAAQREEILALGAAEVVVCKEDGSGIAEAVKKITGGRGAYVAYDCVAGPGFKHFSAAVRDGGTIYNYGGQGGAELCVPINDTIFRGITVKGFWLTPYMRDGPPARAKALLTEVLSLAKQGVFVPQKGQHFALKDVLKALAQHNTMGRDAKFYLKG
ncbi:MAG: hypothetical protein WDW38_003767 [Sanguina aurantia]